MDFPTGAPQDCYFVICEKNDGTFTKDDVGMPILAFNQPIGMITLVVGDRVYGAIWTRYYDLWCRFGKVINIKD